MKKIRFVQVDTAPDRSTDPTMSLEEIYDNYLQSTLPTSTHNTDGIPALPTPADFAEVETVNIARAQHQSSAIIVTTTRIAGLTTTTQLTECVMRHLEKRRKPKKLITSRTFIHRRMNELYPLRGREYDGVFVLYIEGVRLEVPIETDEAYPVQLDGDTVICI